MVSISSAIASQNVPSALLRHWQWLLGLAAIQVVAGVLAIGLPQLASLVAVAAFGYLMLISGAVQIVHAFKVRQWPSWALSLALGVLYVAAGVLALVYPVASMLALTLSLAALFLAEGLIRLLVAWQARQHEGWAWFAFAALASVTLGVLLLLGWPATAIWALGLFLGINLLLVGSSNAIIAAMCRKRSRERDSSSPEAVKAV